MTIQQSFNITVPTWTLTDRLRKSREHAGFTQQELADRIGLSRGAIGNYEQGTNPPKRPTLLAWSLATGVPFTWLETGEIVRPGEPGGEGERHPDEGEGRCAIRDSNPEPADQRYSDDDLPLRAA